MNHHKWLSVWGWVVKSLPDRIRFSLHLPRAGPERRIVPKSRHDETFRRITSIHRYPSHRMIGILGSAGDHSLRNTQIVLLFLLRTLLFLTFSLFLISKMLTWLCTIYQHGGGARRLNIFWAQSIPKLCAFLSAARLSEPLLIILLFCLLLKRSCDFGCQRSNSTFSKEWGWNMPVGQALNFNHQLMVTMQLTMATSWRQF